MDAIHSEVLGHIGRAIKAAGGPAALARELSVSTQAVCFWRDGKRRLPEALGARIERATGGVVTRQELWPQDWSAIWPELWPDDIENHAPEHVQPAQEAIKPIAIQPAPTTQEPAHA